MDKASPCRLGAQRESTGQPMLLPSRKRTYTPCAASQAAEAKKRRVIPTGKTNAQLDHVPSVRTSSQATARAMEVDQDTESTRSLFRAKAVPRSHYQATICIRGSEKPLTVPAALNVLSHSQSRSEAQKSESAACFKARPMPDFSQKLVVKPSEVKTAFQPFPLRTEVRGLEKSISLHHKLSLEAQEQQQKMQFTARPLPSFPPPAPITPIRGPTVPREFQFSPHPKVALPYFPPVNAFRAKPMPDFSKPFQPLLEGKCTQAMDVELNSDVQAIVRARFDQEVREKQVREAQEAALAAETLARVAEEEVRLLRKAMEFKARPLPAPSNFVVFRSEHPPTVPQSPFLRREDRGRTHCGAIFSPNLSEIQSSASTLCTDLSLMTLCEDGK